MISDSIYQWMFYTDHLVSDFSTIVLFKEKEEENSYCKIFLQRVLINLIHIKQFWTIKFLYSLLYKPLTYHAFFFGLASITINFLAVKLVFSMQLGLNRLYLKITLLFFYYFLSLSIVNLCSDPFFSQPACTPIAF